MRWIPPLLFVTGCLSAPSGIDPTAVDGAGGDGSGGDAPGVRRWPPPSADVRAAAVGDVDGDATDDLVLIDAAAGGSGVYLLRGGDELTPTGATTYAAFAPLAGLAAPVAALVLDRLVIVIDNSPPAPRLTVLDAQLAVVSQQRIAMATAIPAGGALTLRATGFGMGGGSAMFAMPGMVGFIERSMLAAAAPAVRLVPPPSGDQLAAPLGADAWMATTPRVLVGEPARALRADVSGTSFTWTTVRSGATWPAQQLADVTGDGVPDLIGFLDDGAAPARVCIHDGALAAGAPQPSCLTTTIADDLPVNMIFDDVGNSGERDLVLVHGGGTSAQLHVLPRLRAGGGAVVSDAAASTLIGDANSLVVSIGLDGAGADELLVVAADGGLACRRLVGAGLVPC